MDGAECIGGLFAVFVYFYCKCICVFLLQVYLCMGGVECIGGLFVEPPFMC